MTAAPDADDQADPRTLHPGPGRALLACRCGRVLDADQMHRYHPPRHTGRSLAIRPITCLECST